mmetsp:Transcript_36746/g.96230  ORF Transcript_36746/g.96230 Transcript_36746/m.96230 type:complete len:210 (-) Transcript_36746:1051-1680(-)
MRAAFGAPASVWTSSENRTSARTVDPLTHSAVSVGLSRRCFGVGLASIKDGGLPYSFPPPVPAMMYSCCHASKSESTSVWYCSTPSRFSSVATDAPPLVSLSDVAAPEASIEIEEYGPCCRGMAVPVGAFEKPAAAGSGSDTSIAANSDSMSGSSGCGVGPLLSCSIGYVTPQCRCSTHDVEKRLKIELFDASTEWNLAFPQSMLASFP